MILVIAAAIYFNKDKIVQMTVEELELSTGTDIEYQSTSIGIDGSFPNIVVGAENLRVSRKNDSFPIVELMSIKAALNPLLFIRNREQIELSKIIVERPDINLVKKENGEANWDFLTQGRSQEDSKGYDISFNRITIENGLISFDDLGSDQSLRILDLNYDGEMTASGNELHQSGKADLKAIINSQLYDSLQYSIDLQLNSNYNTESNSLLISDSYLMVNALDLNLDGKIEQTTEGIDYRLNIESKNQEFSNLLSLLTNLNQIPKDELRASGQFSVSGYLSGLMNDKNPYPKYSLNIDAQDGMFYLPNDPSQVFKIDLNAKLRNQDYTIPYTELSLDRLDLIRDHERVKGSFYIDRMDSTMSVSFDLDAKIDDIKNFDDLVDYNLTGGKIHLLSKGDFIVDNESSGYADAEFKVDWEAENIDFIMDSIRVFSSVSEGLGDQRSVTINFGKTNYGSSDVRGDIVIKKPLDYLKESPSLSLSANLKSGNININELLSSNNSSSEDVSLSWINARIELEAEKLQYQGLPITQFTLDSDIKNDRLIINNSKGHVIDSDFTVIGQMNNMSSYINKTGALIGTLDIDSEELDLDQLEELYYDTTYISQDTSSSDPFENLEIKIISSSNSLNYENTHLYENLASLSLLNDQVLIHDFISSSFGGKLNVQGEITLGEDKSQVELKTNFENISIAESLESLPFFKKISYPLSFIDGRINTTLSLAAGMDQNYDFIYPELNAFALLETIDGKITNFEPLEKLNSILGLESRADLIIKQSKNWITIQNGWVQVEEFSFSIRDYHFKVKGSHSLSNDLNYNIWVEVPSAKISQINMEDHLDPDLLTKLNKYRSVQKGYVGLLFEMKGSVNTPLVKLNEIDVVSAGKALVEQTIQDAKDNVRTKIDTMRGDVEEEIRDTLNEIISNSEEQIGTMLDSAQVVIGEEIKNKLDSTVLNQLDSVGGNIIRDNKTLDSLKNQIFKLKDIFGRKNSK